MNAVLIDLAAFRPSADHTLLQVQPELLHYLCNTSRIDVVNYITITAIKIK